MSYETFTECRIEEGVTLSPYTLSVIAYLQSILDALESGTADSLYADPFAESGLDDANIDALIEAIEAEFATELGQYAGYHRNRSGANALPEFTRLTPPQRRAVAEELLRIIERHAGESS